MEGREHRTKRGNAEEEATFYNRGLKAVAAQVQDLFVQEGYPRGSEICGYNRGLKAVAAQVQDLFVQEGVSAWV